jgi:ribonuclease HI
MAAICAIRTALAAFLDHEDEERNLISGQEICEVLIMTDCNHHVRGMGENIRRWEENGYMTANGTAVANADQFKVLHRLIQNIEGLGTQVQLWHVWKRAVPGAGSLAKEALNAPS